MSADTETPLETETEPQPERPEWLPAQFLTPEDLAKSYAHASAKLTEMGQANSVLRSENAQLLAENVQLLAERELFEERVTTLERGLLKRLVSRRAGV